MRITSWRRSLRGLELANLLVDIVIDKKGSNILLLDIREQAIFADFFVLCNGENRRQIRALAEAIAEGAKERTGLIPQAIEGVPATGWVLVDFGDVLVHLFSPERREYYNLEELWSNAHVVLRMP